LLKKGVKFPGCYEETEALTNGNNQYTNRKGWSWQGFIAAFHPEKMYYLEVNAVQMHSKSFTVLLFRIWICL